MRKTAVLIAGLAITVGVAAWAVTYHLYLGHTGFGFMLVFYLVVAGMVVFYMLSALLSGNYSKLPRADGHVLAVVATYNEPTEALHSTIWALITSVRPPDVIYVMDDGSDTPVETFDHPLVRWLRQANMGKRHAQGNALEIYQDAVNAGDELPADFILTVDGDSTVDSYATDQLMRAFSKPEVQGATGLILVRNWSDNVLTRAQDLDIGTSCMLVRTSRSVFGAVSPTSGAMAMYRSGVLFDNLDDYVSSGTNGDDRRLSLYSLVRKVKLPNGKEVNGKVVAVNSAMVHSAMPTDVRTLFKQRLRWGKSGWQSLPFEIINLSFVPLAFRLYALMLAVLLPFMYAWVAVSVVMHGHYAVIGIAVAASMVIRYGETSLFAMMRPGLSFWQRVFSWVVMTPVAFFMNWVIIRPAKYWALTKLKARGWETRGNAHSARAAHTASRLYRTRALNRRRWALRVATAALIGGGSALGVVYWATVGGRHVDPVAPLANHAPALNAWLHNKPLAPEPADKVKPSLAPAQTATQTAPEPTRTRHHVYVAPVPTPTTHKPSAKPTTAKPTPHPTTSKPAPTPTPSPKPSDSAPSSPTPPPTGSDSPTPTTSASDGLPITIGEPTVAETISTP